MPVPNATGTHGSNRPGPASARIHSRNLPASEDHAPKPDGAKPPACAALRGGQVAATPCASALSRSAIPVALALRYSFAMLPWRVTRRIAERMQNRLKSWPHCLSADGAAALNSSPSRASDWPSATNLAEGNAEVYASLTADVTR